MGLFSKKFCDVCGEKIGLLGNRKLEDGNLCKDCAAKLSPWFSERRSSTVAQIKEQLAYREENKNAVAAFHTTRSFGDRTKLLLDEDAKKFMVTSARNLAEANPDVLDYSQVTGCDLDIDEHQHEEMREVRNADGTTKEVSYYPRRFTFSYDFKIKLRVNTPYFDEMNFDLNGSDVEISGVRTESPNQVLRMANPEYKHYYQMGEEIRQALTEVRDTIREEINEAARPKEKVICPYCGASTIPDANGCCEYCGAALTGR